MNNFIGLEHNKDRDKRALEKGDAAHTSVAGRAMLSAPDSGEI